MGSILDASWNLSSKYRYYREYSDENLSIINESKNRMSLVGKYGF
jgi:hypothetical protein